MKISGLGEFGLIEEIAAKASPAAAGVLGIGDDCAVMPQTDGMDSLVSTDMLIEGCHFILSDISPRQLGWKSAAVNISDIAAMGGKPDAAFLSFALPPSTDIEWVREFMKGFREALDRYGLSLLGGDSCSSPDRVCINVAVTGHCPHGSARLRSGARPGDLVCVTGMLGGSAAGLKVILEGLARTPELDALVSRHYLPEPRVEEGLALASCPGVHSMMDVSDGIASDLRHILKASGVGAQVDCRTLPLFEGLEAAAAKYGWDPVSLATEGGEDYELLFTLDPEYESGLAVPHTVIGRIISSPEPEIEWLGAKGELKGFTHF